MPEEVVIDYTRCLGCKSCELACAVEHSAGKSLARAVYEANKPRKRIFVEPAGEYSVPLNCRHCENAPCMRACPTASMYRMGEKVYHASEFCLGCSACRMACPFGVITQYFNSKIVAKCDRCPERDIPACVTACPTGALKYGEPDELAQNQRQKIIRNFVSSQLNTF